MSDRTQSDGAVALDEWEIQRRVFALSLANDIQPWGYLVKSGVATEASDAFQRVLDTCDIPWKLEVMRVAVNSLPAGRRTTARVFLTYDALCGIFEQSLRQKGGTRSIRRERE